MAIRAYGQQQIQVEPPLDLQALQPVEAHQEDDGTYLFIAEKLMRIVLKHQDKRDPLSNKLFMQGSDFALFMINGRGEELPRETLIAHFLGLKAAVSQECRFEKVTNIWLSGSVAWEKKELDLYCKALAYRSNQIVIATPHTFGNEILQWIHDLERPFERLAPAQELTLPTLTEEVNDLGMPVVRGLEDRDEDLITVLTNADPEEPMDARTADKVLIKFNERMDEIIIEREKIRCTEVLKKQNAFLTKSLEQKNDQFGKDIVRRAESDQEQINFLTHSLHRTEANYESTNEERKKRENQLEKALEQYKQELSVSKTEVVALKGRVSNLESSNYWLNQRVDGLQREVNNMDDGRCLIS